MVDKKEEKTEEVFLSLEEQTNIFYKNIKNIIPNLASKLSVLQRIISDLRIENRSMKKLLKSPEQELHAEIAQLKLDLIRVHRTNIDLTAKIQKLEEKLLSYKN